MWKISNQTNKSYLDQFQFSVIRPFFTMLVECSWTKNYNLDDYLINTSNILIKKNLETLQNMLNRKHKKEVFRNICTRILRKYTYSQIIDVYARYSYEYRMLDVFNYNYLEIEIPSEFKFIFVEFFYGKFFKDKEVWNDILYTEYDRKRFHTNFKSENKLLVCPYCDLESTQNLSNNFIEHFLPKDRYPLLSMHPNNLISSCYACNTRGEGKGTDVKLPIKSPYQVQIGDEVEFEIDYSGSTVKIDSTQPEIKNYLKLLHLKDRYASLDTFNSMVIHASAIYDPTYRWKLDKSELIEYVLDVNTRMRKSRSMGFLLTKLYNDLDDYIDYKNNF